jgi:hypothetical protein
MNPTAEQSSNWAVLVKVSTSEAIVIIDCRFLLFLSSCRPLRISNSYTLEKKHRKHFLRIESISQTSRVKFLNVDLFIPMCQDILDLEDEATHSTWPGYHGGFK